MDSRPILIADTLQNYRDVADLDVSDLPPHEVAAMVAHSLALENRFTGLSPFPYSVAQHSLIGAWMMAAAPKYRLAFLLHELDEVFLRDIHSQLKPRLWVEDGHGVFEPYKQFAERHETALLKGLKLRIPDLEHIVHSPLIKEVDERMLLTEKSQFFPDMASEHWAFTRGLEPFDVRLSEWDWRTAQEGWMRMYRTLVEQC